MLSASLSGSSPEAVALDSLYITAEPRVTDMLKHATVIDATVGQSSQIGVTAPDDGEDDEEKRATGVARLLSWCRRFAR